MKIRLLVFAVSALPLIAFGAAVVKLVREPGAIALAVQKGYGVQKDGKHELTITSVTTGQMLKSVKSFKGTTAPEDKKYFGRIEAIDFPQANGKIRITGRIFYCSFAQKFCSVQKVDEEL